MGYCFETEEPYEKKLCDHHESPFAHHVFPMDWIVFVEVRIVLILVLSWCLLTLLTLVGCFCLFYIIFVKGLPFELIKESDCVKVFT